MSAPAPIHQQAEDGIVSEVERKIKGTKKGAILAPFKLAQLLVQSLHTSGSFHSLNIINLFFMAAQIKYIVRAFA